MKRNFIIAAAVLAAGLAFGGLVHIVLVATRLSEPAANTVYGITARRLWASASAVLALAGVVVGGLPLAQPTSRFSLAYGRIGAIVALIAGPVAVASSWLNLITACGGPGTGNGVVGAAGALVLGAISMVVGGLSLARTRRAG